MNASGRPLRLLVVDDDAVDRMAVRRALQRAGVDAVVDEAVDAIDALERLGSADYDCVFLDYNIPHGDGLTLMQGISRARLAVPVIILSGQEDTTIIAELLHAGAVDYVSKDSVTPARLRLSLERAASAADRWPDRDRT